LRIELRGAPDLAERLALALPGDGELEEPPQRGIGRPDRRHQPAWVGARLRGAEEHDALGTPHPPSARHRHDSLPSSPSPPLMSDLGLHLGLAPRLAVQPSPALVASAEILALTSAELERTIERE